MASLMHSDCVSGGASAGPACCPETARDATGPAADRAGPKRRIAAAAAASFCLAVLAAAALLEPYGRGYGTHEQLGLPQCSFVVRHGLPCPTCGLTTSVSAVMHGRFVLAARAQPFGIFLVLAAALVAVAGTTEALTGRRWLARLRPGLWWLWAGLGGVLAGWLIVLAAGYACGSLPVH